MIRGCWLISKPFFYDRSCATDGHLASAQSEPEDCVPRRAQPRWPCRVCYVQSCKRPKRDSPDTIIPVSDEFIVICGVESHPTRYCECFVGPDTMIYWTDVVAASHRRLTLRTADEEDIWVRAFDLPSTSFTPGCLDVY